MKKQARITFNKYVDHKGQEQEEYRIELYDEEYGDWGLDTAYRFTRSAKTPEAKEAEFLHFDIVSKILELLRLGYTIRDDR